jgi:2-polyprenyl-6-methoxyphenol hydroxylase-like FAD-dependent oxidoreductase
VVFADRGLSVSGDAANLIARREVNSGKFRGPRCLTDEQFWYADPVALHAVSERVKEWPPSLRRIAAEADIPATFSVSFHASELLGDAIHTMPRFRGGGANTALRDAELLSHKLMDVAEKDDRSKRSASTKRRCGATDLKQ